jgi:hypothetical protein
MNHVFQASAVTNPTVFQLDNPFGLDDVELGSGDLTEERDEDHDDTDLLLAGVSQSEIGLCMSDHPTVHMPRIEVDIFLAICATPRSLDTEQDPEEEEIPESQRPTEPRIPVALDTLPRIMVRDDGEYRQLRRAS